jgi:ornithine cyclodeaminase/alanine dehydrogenase-like protein (mu-crystallin family)
MHHVTAEEAQTLLDYPGLIAALHAAHAADLRPDTYRDIREDQSANAFVSLLSWADQDVIAVKMVGVFPGNPGLKPPQPSVQGLVLLFDGKTGRPLMTADGAELTFRKTAADSALGASFLARQDARTLLVCGAGGLAPHVIAAHRTVRPGLSRVLIWNRSPARAKALAESIAVEAEITAIDDLDAALPEADVISCVTMATKPIVKGALLKPGAHVDLIGAYQPQMRESDDETIRRAGRIFLDTRLFCERSGDIAEPLARDIITREGLVADLFDLCCGRHSGRSSPAEITVYKNSGGGHLDLFTARHLYARIMAG